MPINLAAASDFMAGHARLLDQQRFRFLTGAGDPDATLTALEAYRNPDGGYGWGLEPDLRSPESQPGPALHAFEVFTDIRRPCLGTWPGRRGQLPSRLIGPVTSPRAVQLCDWLATITLPDGGVPFALPVTRPAASAPFWTDADPSVSSLQISAIVAENAHRAAAHDPAVANHPWLARISEYCLSTIRKIDEQPHALALAFSVRFLDAAHGGYPEAATLIRQLRAYLPPDGMVHVGGGADDEFMRPLDFAPFPGGPARELFAPNVIDAELRRLAGEQQADGGWKVDFASYSPAAALEWRGYGTVKALSILSHNGFAL